MFFSLDIAKEIKLLLPNTLIVLGGVHASFLYDQILKNFNFIDCVVKGEGEETFSEVIDCVREGNTLENVKGLAFRKGSDIFLNEERPFIKDLDAIPFPTYIEHFICFNGQSMKSASMITSRGCSGGCRFCSVPGFWGKTRFRSPENVINEMSILIHQHKVKYINFMDDTFTENPKRVNKICHLINTNGWNVKWRATARVDTLTPELLKTMKEAGCVEISIGVESGNQDILNRLGKKTTIEKIQNICSAIKALKIRLEACFIVGSPGESEMTIEYSKKLMAVIDPDVFNVSQSLYIFPGTAFSRQLTKKGIYDESLWLHRNIDSIKYLAEHEEHVLTQWQMELIKTGWTSLSFKNKMKYILGILKWIKLSHVYIIVINLLKSMLFFRKVFNF